ncbi:TPA: SHOCT domain-containing protein [Enterococcus faecalis]
MEQCFFCTNKLNLFKTVTLSSGEKICSKCRDDMKKELGLGLFDRFKYSLDEIYSMYKEKGINLEKIHQDREEFLIEIKNVGESFSKTICIVGGSNLLGTSEHSHIHQLKDGRIYFKDNYDDFFYLLKSKFDGPRYKTVTTEVTQETTNTDTIEKTKKKGKSGKIAAGAMIGSIVAPGIGTVVGAYAGSRGKDKKNKKTSQQVDTKNHKTNTKKEVEENSTCIMELERVSDNKVFSIVLKVYSKDYYEISSGIQVKSSLGINLEFLDLSREQAIEKLKELKELVDIGILNEDEFSEKKAEYMKFI